MENKISAKVVSMEKGLEKYTDIKMVRLKSVDHTLLIMEDFMPVIGEIDGLIELVTDDDVIKYHNIRGFYMHKHNEFNLLISKFKEQSDV